MCPLPSVTSCQMSWAQSGVRPQQLHNPELAFLRFLPVSEVHDQLVCFLGDLFRRPKVVRAPNVQCGGGVVGAVTGVEGGATHRGISLSAKVVAAAVSSAS